MKYWVIERSTWKDNYGDVQIDYTYREQLGKACYGSGCKHNRNTGNKYLLLRDTEKQELGNCLDSFELHTVCCANKIMTLPCEVAYKLIYTDKSEITIKEALDQLMIGLEEQQEKERAMVNPTIKPNGRIAKKVLANFRKQFGYHVFKEDR